METVAKCKTIIPEFGLAHLVGDAMDAPVMILKSCIGYRGNKVVNYKLSIAPNGANFRLQENHRLEENPSVNENW